jgi:hypothetical protein
MSNDGFVCARREKHFHDREQIGGGCFDLPKMEACMLSEVSPKVVPYGADQTAYLVVDSFGAKGSVYREAEVERTDLEAVIDDLLAGQFNNPVRVIAFNTLEHWAEDVSAPVAVEIQARCDIDGQPLPEHVRDFVETYARLSRQLALHFV